MDQLKQFEYKVYGEYNWIQALFYPHIFFNLLHYL
jgi:hypothetical protein